MSIQKFLYVVLAFGGIATVIFAASSVPVANAKSNADSNSDNPKGSNLNISKLPPSFLNVRSYGATGDGKTDDTAAIQETINAADAAGGGETATARRLANRDRVKERACHALYRLIASGPRQLPNNRLHLSTEEIP